MSRPRSAEESPREPTRLLPAVRVGLALLFVLAILNGGFLLLFPSLAKTDYAWPISPAVSAAFMGAGYVAGAVGTGLAVFTARRWGSVSALVPGFCALGAVAFAATLIHQEKFRWDYAPTWGWAIVYATLPFGAAALVWLQSREGEESARTEGLTPLVAVSYVLGVVTLAAAVALFVAPAWLLEDWPWKLTPLIARVFAAWYVLAGVTLLVAARRAVRPHQLPIPYGTLAIWSGLLLLLPLLHADDVEGTALLVPWLLFHMAVLGLCVVIVAGALAAMRRTGQAL